MQHVNDDMDELFRESAENYPLNTGGADWSQVQQKMQQAHVESKMPIAGNGKAKYLALLLLLPMFFICNHFTNEKDLASGVKTESTSGTAAVEENNNHKTLEENSLKESDVAKENTGTKESNTGDEKITKNGSNTGNTTAASTSKDIETAVRGEEKNIDPTLLAGSKKSVNRGRQHIKSVAKTDKKIVSTFEKEQVTAQSLKKEGNNIENSKETESTSQTGNAPGSGSNDNNPKNIEKTESPIGETSKVADSAVKETPVQTQLPVSKKKNINKKKETKLYVGVVAGPDYSMVKSTSSNQAGYSVGLLAGYRFANNFSIETGLLWDRKRYRSTGEDFNPKKMNLASNSYLLKVWGYCDMLEIPINLRYDFSVKKGHSWFATAGLSSYLMKKEDYNYSYKHNSAYYHGWKSYDNASSNWMSVANLSIGYQKTIGNIGNLRIEPYLKLPVRGVGIGDMRLRSTGVYVGFTRPIR